jgi:hypothetical protein
MKHRRWIAPVVALAALAVVAVLLGNHVNGSGRRTGGPLACADCDRTATSILVRRGQRASFGLLGLSNHGSRPATLEAVRLLDADPAFELVGTLVVEPDGTGSIGVVLGFPPADPGGRVVDVAGYVIQPARSAEDFVQILVGATITKRGRHGARQIAVDYRVGGRPYRAVFDNSLWLCTHGDVPDDGCTNPDL